MKLARVFSVVAATLAGAVLTAVCLAQATSSRSSSISSSSAGTAPASASQPSQDPSKPAPRDAKWMTRHGFLVADAKKGDIDVYFLGDSITDGWRGKGKEIWDKEFAPLKAGNFGIGGDRTQHVLYRITEGEFPDTLKPKVVVLMIGTNNVKAGNTSEPIAGGVKTIIETIRTKSPQTKILLLSVFPRGTGENDPLSKGVIELNKVLPGLADGKAVVYLDIYDKFLEKDGTISRDTMYDLLHPTAKGYQIWADAIRDPLKKMLGK